MRGGRFLQAEFGPALREERLWVTVWFLVNTAGGTVVVLEFSQAGQVAGGTFGRSAAGLGVRECRYLEHGGDGSEIRCLFLNSLRKMY